MLLETIETNFVKTMKVEKADWKTVNYLKQKLEEMKFTDFKVENKDS